ncbi:MAG: hypothetical protein ACI95S_001132 [Dinoroseobacter sp.]|jgi:hypothetical protein
MKSLVAAGLIATLVVAGCGTRLNPLNWFGSSEETITAAPADFVTDPRPLVSQVTSLQIERTVGGAIIRAVGLPPSQGYWDAELVPLNNEEPDENRVLAYEFRISTPVFARSVSTQQSREVVVAHFISDRGLDGVRRITVSGSETSRSTNR